MIEWTLASEKDFIYSYATHIKSDIGLRIFISNDKTTGVVTGTLFNEDNEVVHQMLTSSETDIITMMQKIGLTVARREGYIESDTV